MVLKLSLNFDHEIDPNLKTKIEEELYTYRLQHKGKFILFVVVAYTKEIVFTFEGIDDSGTIRTLTEITKILRNYIKTK